MKRILCSIILAVSCSSALASDYGLSTHAVYGALGFTAGGFALGVDYEYLGLKDFGAGGYLRMYQKDDGTTHKVPGYTIIGGFIRPHFNKKAWDFYISPGFAIISIDDTNNTPGDSTTLGPSLAIGLMYDFNGSMAFGIENMRHWVWFDSDWRGQQVSIDDFMMKFRVSF